MIKCQRLKKGGAKTKSEQRLHYLGGQTIVIKIPQKRLQVKNYQTGTSEPNVNEVLASLLDKLVKSQESPNPYLLTERTTTTRIRHN